MPHIHFLKCKIHTKVKKDIVHWKYYPSDKQWYSLVQHFLTMTLESGLMLNATISYLANALTFSMLEDLRLQHLPHYLSYLNLFPSDCQSGWPFARLRKAHTPRQDHRSFTAEWATGEEVIYYFVAFRPLMKGCYCVVDSWGMDERERFFGSGLYSAFLALIITMKHTADPHRSAITLKKKAHMQSIKM